MRVEANANSASASVRAGARNAATAIGFYRKIASSNAKVQALQKSFNGIQIMYDHRILQTDDDGQKVVGQIINQLNTVATNQKSFDGQAIRDTMNLKVDSAHEENIR